MLRRRRKLVTLLRQRWWIDYIYHRWRSNDFDEPCVYRNKRYISHSSFSVYNYIETSIIKQTYLYDASSSVLERLPSGRPINLGLRKQAKLIQMYCIWHVICFKPLQVAPLISVKIKWAACTLWRGPAQRDGAAPRTVTNNDITQHTYLLHTYNIIQLTHSQTEGISTKKFVKCVLINLTESGSMLNS